MFNSISLYISDTYYKCDAMVDAASSYQSSEGIYSYHLKSVIYSADPAVQVTDVKGTLLLISLIQTNRLRLLMQRILLTMLYIPREQAHMARSILSIRCRKTAKFLKTVPACWQFPSPYSGRSAFR